MSTASLLPDSPADVLPGSGAHNLHGDDNLHRIELCAPKSAAAKFLAAFTFSVAFDTQAITAHKEEFCR